LSTERQSERWLAWELGVPLAELRRLASAIDSHYSPFAIKQEGRADRTIDNPDETLKDVQRRIRTSILLRHPLDDSVHGCVKGRSALTNAEVHCGCASLARIDVKNCFPSVTNRMVFRVLRDAGYGSRVASLLTILVTRAGHLPQGAPTSDRLANLALGAVDNSVRDIANALGLHRRRFVDDFTLSGDRAREAIGPVIAALQREGFAVRHRKTSNAGATKPHRVTGYVVNAPARPSVSQEKRQQIRSAVYQIVRAHRNGEAIDKRLRSVRGSLAYLRRTNLGLVGRLERQLDVAGISLKMKQVR
jgi:RNA-directed DNA polymerase